MYLYIYNIHLISKCIIKRYNFVFSYTKALMMCRKNELLCICIWVYICSYYAYKIYFSYFTRTKCFFSVTTQRYIALRILPKKKTVNTLKKIFEFLTANNFHFIYSICTRLNVCCQLYICRGICSSRWLDGHTMYMHAHNSSILI